MGLEYRWEMRPLSDPDSVPRLQKELNNLPFALARSLAVRGIETLDQAREFFRPNLEDLHDPFLMKDMDVASDRVVRAIRDRERVLVYGDYDVDGTTATALMVTFLRDHGVDALYFIPDRYRDGYGLTPIGIDYAVNSKATLVVALDCGVTGHTVADYAREQGLDLVICDHHTPEDTLPNATAVLDPLRPDCPYPFDGLSGCGVGFKLMQAVLERLGRPPEEAYPYLDLVALSIASDVVPIVGENRILMREGLEVLKERSRLGIRVLASHAGLDLTRCTTGQIGFGIGPRLNAAGRMANARKTVELLAATNEDVAAEIATHLENVNLTRRQLDSAILEDSIQIVKNHPQQAGEYALVLFGEDWHLGVIGIVASRLVERFYRPVVMLTRVNGDVKGSARSIKGFSIYDGLKQCSHLLTRFGGHKYAAGMTLPEENVGQLRHELNRIVEESVTDDMLKPEILVDSSLNLNDLSPRFWKILSQFGPFGPENSTPVFKGTQLRVATHPTIVGDGHLKFKVRQSGAPDQPVYEVIGFQKHELLPLVRSHKGSGEPIQMVFSVDLNDWGGHDRLQLKMKDLRPDDGPHSGVIDQGSEETPSL